ncbi:hypothetical protein [Streptomyces yangpuensis]|uniref:hypothetical protein n=1 Tax=Streptomyces yangpuensis TaxID=1648182 RepID=UPI0037F1AE17
MIIHGGVTLRMRTRSLLASATAVTALLTLTACGSGENQSLGGIGSDTGTGARTDGGPDEGTLANPTKNGGAMGNAPEGITAFQKLPKAGTMAAAARFIGGFTDCGQVSADYGEDGPTGLDAAFNKAGTVTETGYCGRQNRTTIILYKDAKAFQTAFKAEMAKQGNKGNPDGGIVVGQDFAMGSQDADSMSALLQPQAGLLMLNCHPGFKPPGGFRKEPALVKGCVLTDYYKDH